MKTFNARFGAWALLLSLFGSPAGLRAQPTFTNVTAAVAPGLPYGCSTVAWGDYDNDGRLDLFIGGATADDNGDDIFYAQLWRNTDRGFTNVTATVAPGMTGAGGSAAWGDYDNDGRLDLLFTGQRGLESVTTELWRNTGTGFVNVTVPDLTGVESSFVAWGDYDNDGRLDFLFMGFMYDFNDNFLEVPTQLWRNTGSGFTNVTDSVLPGLPQVTSGSVAWADYDNDGRLDFLITGWEFFSHRPVAQLWRNTGNGFTNLTATVAPGLPQVSVSSVAWGDYDNDGRLDFLLAGFSEYNVFISQLWRNTGAGFTNVTAAIAPELTASYPYSSSVAWGDYNNDGRLDFLLSGHCYPNGGTGSVSQLWQNTGTGFSNVTASIGLPLFSPAAWGDFDNDGRLDLISTEFGTPQLWRNTTPVTNTPPSAPTGLAMTASSNAVMLSWNSATDGQTPASGLTYNVRAGTTPGGNNLLSAHVNATNGFRRVPAMGNAMLRHSLPLTGLTNGQVIYWSVQAVDTAFAGGPFATETSVVSLPQLSVTRPDATNVLVSWTPPTFGWTLQQGTNLSVNNWTPTASGSANPAILPATNATTFYRLSKP